MKYRNNQKCLWCGQETKAFFEARSKLFLAWLIVNKNMPRYPSNQNALAWYKVTGCVQVLLQLQAEQIASFRKELTAFTQAGPLTYLYRIIDSY